MLAAMRLLSTCYLSLVVGDTFYLAASQTDSQTAYIKVYLLLPNQLVVCLFLSRSFSLADLIVVFALQCC